ncbi:hypothetical protein M8494_21275 [Serratia ureilytica]
MILFSKSPSAAAWRKEQVKKLAFQGRAAGYSPRWWRSFLVFIIGLIGYFPTTRVSAVRRPGLGWYCCWRGTGFKVNHENAPLATQQD